MQQSTVSKTSSFNSCLFPAGKILRVPGRGASSSHGRDVRGAFMALPTSAAPRRIRPPFRSAKGPSAEAPSALPKPTGRCSVSSRHCPSSWHGSEGSRCHPGSGRRDRVATVSETQRKEGRHWQLQVLQLIWLQKASLGWVSVCSPLVALSHPCEVWAGFGVADTSPDKGT